MPVANDIGFVRPSIKLPREYFNNRLLQGARGQGLSLESLSVETLQCLWTSITDQVLNQRETEGFADFLEGLRLGVVACSPSISLATEG